jgi:hypothetical protein
VSLGKEMGHVLVRGRMFPCYMDAVTRRMCLQYVLCEGRLTVLNWSLASQTVRFRLPNVLLTISQLPCINLTVCIPGSSIFP